MLRLSIIKRYHHPYIVTQSCTRRHKSSSSPLASLRDREMIADCTDMAGLNSMLDKQSIAVYSGFDPTADSLHVGNLLALMALFHFHFTGHQAIALIGGATGGIGDPSGRSTERNAIDWETVGRNSQSIHQQIKRIFNQASHMYHRGEPSAVDGERDLVVVDNIEWTKPISLVDFLRDTGKHARLADMLGRESVRSRLEPGGRGMSYTEFTYQLLQANDYRHLHHHHGCRLQLGGSDQWGNIVAGCDLIHKTLDKSRDLTETDCSSHAYGLTLPLMTAKNGEKFGKSAGNAIWLAAERTSPFDLYQFFTTVDDDQVQQLLMRLTLLPVTEIHSLMEEHEQNRDRRLAQRRLADSVCRLVHGDMVAAKARVMTRILYGSDGELNDSNSTADELIGAFEGDKRLYRFPTSLFSSPIPSIFDLATQSGAASSKKEARRIFNSGGFYLNNRRITDAKYQISDGDLIGGKLLVLRLGKSNYRLLEFPAK